MDSSNLWTCAGTAVRQRHPVGRDRFPRGTQRSGTQAVCSSEETSLIKSRWETAPADPAGCAGDVSTYFRGLTSRPYAIRLRFRLM